MKKENYYRLDGPDAIPNLILKVAVPAVTAIAALVFSLLRPIRFFGHGNPNLVALLIISVAALLMVLHVLLERPLSQGAELRGISLIRISLGLISIMPVLFRNMRMSWNQYLYAYIGTPYSFFVFRGPGIWWNISLIAAYGGCITAIVGAFSSKRILSLVGGILMTVGFIGYVVARSFEYGFTWAEFSHVFFAHILLGLTVILLSIFDRDRTPLNAMPRRSEPSSKALRSAGEELRELKHQKDAGILSDEEYERKRKEVLDRI